VPTGRLYIGVVLRDFNYDQAVARTSQLVKKAGMKLVPFDDAYISWGDRCKDAEKDDAELSHLVTDLAGWDQIIVTPAGKAPPNITSELQGLGLEREASGLGAYTAEARRTLAEINTSDTYTFCFWGCSRIVDVQQWKFRFATMHVDMSTFFQEWPMHGVMYELLPAAPGSSDDRHLESRKRYYLDFMFWNSQIDVSECLPERYNFMDAPKAATAAIDDQKLTTQGASSSGDAPHKPGGRAVALSCLLPLWLTRAICGGGDPVTSAAGGGNGCIPRLEHPPGPRDVN